jgi:DNA-binding NtrC family response regulator
MSKKILLIEDDTTEIETFKNATHLIDKKIECVVAKTLAEITAILLDNDCPFVFIKSEIKGSNGLELLTEIKKIDSSGRTRIILYSNDMTDKMRQSAMKAGAYITLKKPRMINNLAMQLKEILNE